MSSQACWSDGGRNAPDDRNSRKWPPSWPWIAPKSRGRIRIGRCRATDRSRSNAVVAAALLDLALDGAPEQVEDLRHHDHRGDALVAQGIEDDPRVPAADVEDVGPTSRA